MADAPAPNEPDAKGGSGLGKKVGPFPMWVWIVGVGGVALWYYKSRQAAAAAAGTDTSGTLTAGAPLDGSTGQLPTSPSITDSGQTIDQWRQAAFAALTGAGVNPALAEEALSNFINQNQLGPLQSGAISKALGLVGSPPVNLPFYGQVPSSGPTSKPPPVPTSGKPHDPGFIEPIAAPPHVNMAPGEHIVEAIKSTLGGPNAGYYLTNLGGVYAVGGAPFLGSAFTRPHAAGTEFTSIEGNNAGGYTLVASNGHTMSFAGKAA